MNQAEVAKLVSGLRVKLSPVAISSQRRKVFEGYRGQLTQLRETVSALVAHERLEVTANKGLLTRMYAERLIQEAMEHGDTHRETMEVARWWLKDDATLVHKLFKVTFGNRQHLSTIVLHREGPKSV